MGPNYKEGKNFDKIQEIFGVVNQPIKAPIGSEGPGIQSPGNAISPSLKEKQNASIRYANTGPEPPKEFPSFKSKSQGPVNRMLSKDGYNSGPMGVIGSKVAGFFGLESENHIGMGIETASLFGKSKNNTETSANDTESNMATNGGAPSDEKQTMNGDRPIFSQAQSDSDKKRKQKETACSI